MKRDYEFHDINEQYSVARTVDGKVYPRFGCEQRLLEKTNKTLIENFNKVAEWVSQYCPTLNGEFFCQHNTYHWTALKVEDGKAYFEYGSHGYGFDLALSITETAVFSRGSMQRTPYAFAVQFARNDRLEEFLKQWASIKAQIVAEYNRQQSVYSHDFIA